MSRLNLETYLGMVRCLVTELGADVNQAKHDGCTPVYIAAENGDLNMVRCLAKDFLADVNKAKLNGATPLMVASTFKHADVVTWLVKAGANPQIAVRGYGTAADFSRVVGACAEQTVYLDAMQDALLQSRLQRCWRHGVHGMQAGAVLWGAVPAGALEGAQGRLQAVERGAGGWHGQLRLVMSRAVGVLVIYTADVLLIFPVRSKA
jgi:hypothetical protein